MSADERISTKKFAKLNHEQQADYLLKISILNLGNAAQTIYRHGKREDTYMSRVSESAYAQFRLMKSRNGDYSPFWQEEIRKQENEIGALISNSLEEYINRPSGKFNDDGSSLCNGEVKDKDLLEECAYIFRDILIQRDREGSHYDGLSDMWIEYPIDPRGETRGVNWWPE